MQHCFPEESSPTPLRLVGVTACSWIHEMHIAGTLCMHVNCNEPLGPCKDSLHALWSCSRRVKKCTPQTFFAERTGHSAKSALIKVPTRTPCPVRCLCLLLRREHRPPSMEQPISKAERMLNFNAHKPQQPNLSSRNTSLSLTTTAPAAQKDVEAVPERSFCK